MSTLNVSGNTTLNNATTINSTFNISGNTTISNSLYIGQSNSYPDLRLGSTNGNNIGIATIATAFSNSSGVNDMVIRSINKLILQSGSGVAGLIIDTNNYTALRKILKFSDVAVGDDIPFMNDLIFNKGAIMAASGTSIETAYYVTLSRLKVTGVKFGFNIK